MLYVRFPLSLRNVEDLLYERDIDVSYEAVRFWWNRFGQMFASPHLHQPPSSSNKVIRRTVLCSLSGPLKAIEGSPPHAPWVLASHTHLGTHLHSGAAYVLFAAAMIDPKSLHFCCSGTGQSSDDTEKADQSRRALPPACRSYT